MNRKRLNTIEILLHFLFWLLIFITVNVDWSSNWLDTSIRPNTPAPLSVLIFPLLFYAHALWAIPNYLNQKKWKLYLLCFLLIFIVPEMLRSGLFVLLQKNTSFGQAWISRDSFLLGSPNVFWMALTSSFAYRFTKDWFIHQKQMAEKAAENSDLSEDKLISVVQPLEQHEAEALRIKLDAVLLDSQAFLNPKLSLRELADLVETNDKKLSTLLNQNLHTNFYDYINAYRIQRFKERANKGDLKSLSVLGLASACGFTSKSSFYRAFKKKTGMTPSTYLKKSTSL
ncbi:MAG TPA: AraC family transcriptional regulator [Saprospiraceae bacterium]|nr:AraC family transcriptional regulator [Saprospiraceae bacterium]HMQ83879.1 AraC family transcriptional regulator [Saprospiraceae bacterium]